MKIKKSSKYIAIQALVLDINMLKASISKNLQFGFTISSRRRNKKRI